MTNFEKWKENLTAEKASDIMTTLCINCPLLGSCVDLKGNTCNEILINWFNEEAKE